MDRSTFDGFWPPEFGFTMEFIPLLRRLGYRYVIVDCEHVEPAGRIAVGGDSLPTAHRPLRWRVDSRDRP
jgi:predicted glycosyl hydrolase (DUF1957 family)